MGQIATTLAMFRERREVFERAVDDNRRKVVAGILIWSATFIGCVLLFLPEVPRDQSILSRPFRQQEGHAYLARPLIGGSPDNKEHPDQSTLQIYEDGVPLGPQHVSSDFIARDGRGRYLYWQENHETALVFSTSDNSDPNTNGRTYRIFDPAWKDKYRVR